MGSAIGAFMQGIQGTLGAKLEKKHDEEESLKKEQRDHLWQVIHDPKTSEVGVKMAADALAKLQNPETRKGFQKILPQLNQIIHRAKQQGQQQSQPAPAPQTQEATSGQLPVGTQVPAQAPMSESLGMSAGTKLPPPTSPRAQFNKGPDFAGMMRDYGTQIQQRQDERLNKLADQADLKGRDRAVFIASGGTKIPPQEKLVTVKNVARDGVDPATGKPYEGLWDHEVKPDGSETWAKRPEDAKSRPTILSSDVVTVDHARQLKQAGVPYHDADGNEIDLDKVPPGMVLQAIHQGTKTFYAPRDVQQKVVDVNGVKYAVSPFEVQDLPKGAGTTLGAKNAPTSGSHDVPAVDAQGSPTVNTLRTTRTPGASGIPGRPGDRGASPAAKPAPAPSPAARTAAPQASAPAAAPTGGSVMRGMQPGYYNQMLQRLTPVREALTQFYGDPANPEMKGLDSFASLADDKGAQERLGKAFEIIFKGIDQDTSGAHISASAGPISVSTGGIGEVLTNYFGVPQKLAQQRAAIVQDVISKLTPQEQDYVNAAMASFGVAVGLRSLSKASASQASVATIERELPLIGLGTTNSRQFKDKMLHLAEVTQNGAKGIPKGMVDPELQKRVDGLTKKGPAKAPSSGKTPKTADEYLKSLAAQ